ncbi:hypothetical protein B0H11DRAFT_188095 [Mycena galericulata]|nr:hypothetical protein B0H11DRAFT_188095 [Mycena galericulata]
MKQYKFSMAVPTALTIMTRLFVVLLFLFAVTSSATAAARETNGERMAKGLPPLPPRWMPTRTRIYDTTNPPSPSPSGSILLCRDGNAPLCCNSAVPASDTTAAFLLRLLGAEIPGPDSGLVGITCSPLRIGTCANRLVCCDHNAFDGVVATGCELRRP